MSDEEVLRKIISYMVSKGKLIQMKLILILSGLDTLECPSSDSCHILCSKFSLERRSK